MTSAAGDLDVVVIGAGAAGIAATWRLIEARADVLLVEARDRIGGRARTAQVEGRTRVDLGCGWLHSADRNPWTSLATEAGFDIDRTLPPWQNDDHDLGLPRPERAAFQAAASRFCDRLDAVTDSAGDRPAAEFLEPGCPWNSLIDATSTYINGAELDRISTLDFARYHDTGVNWRVPDGYGSLIAHHGRGLPLMLDCRVTGIDHRGPRVRIETERGTLTARAVIVTASTDVLAAETIRFSPGLPAKLQSAVDLPLGNAEKLFLALDGARDFPQDVRFFGAADRVATGSYHMRPFGRPMIEAYFGGRLARELQLAGEAAMTAFATAEIAAVLGHAIAARLRPLAASAWASDPFALGSYSHALPGRSDARSVLAAAVDARIFFAGEACSIHDFSTAHGAYWTGEAAAEAVLRCR